MKEIEKWACMQILDIGDLFMNGRVTGCRDTGLVRLKELSLQAETGYDNKMQYCLMVKYDTIILLYHLLSVCNIYYLLITVIWVFLQTILIICSKTK